MHVLEEISADISENDITSEDTLNFREIILKLLNTNQNYGFHLIRTLWDPYPRIDKIDDNSIAFNSNIKIGDFIIKINNKSLLGTNIHIILKIVKSSNLQLKLTLWNPGLEHPYIDIMASIVNLLSCPVCASAVAKRPRQCRNGHLICTDCVLRTSKCPICRAPLRRPPNDAKALPGARCLIAEQLTTVFQTSGVVTTRAVAAAAAARSDGAEFETPRHPTDTDEAPARPRAEKSGNFASKLTRLWRGRASQRKTQQMH